MNKKKELAKNTIIILFGKICTQFISFFFLPLYTSLLSTEEYGVVDLIISYVSLLVPLITLQLENAIFRFLIDKRNEDNGKSKIITNSYITAIFLCIITFIIFCVINIFIQMDYAIYIILLVFCTILSNIQLQTARGLGDNIGYSIGSVIAGGCTILFNVLFLVVFKFGIEGMLLSSTLANFLCFLFLFFKNKVYHYIKVRDYSKEQVKELLKYSLPLVPNGIIWWVINVSDRTIISIMLGSSANGIYAVANKFSHLFVSIYNIFNISWTESAAMHINDEDKEEFFSSTINTMFKLFSCTCLGIIAYLSILFPYFVNRNYNEAYNYIPILMIATLFNVIVGLLSVIYVAKKKSNEIAKTSFISGIINIAINLMFIKWIGIYAAAISTLVAFGTMAIYRYIDVQKYVKIRFDKKIIIITCIAFIVCVGLYYINNFILNVINCIIITIYAIVMNKEFIKEGVKTIKDGISKLRAKKK